MQLKIISDLKITLFELPPIEKLRLDLTELIKTRFFFATRKSFLHLRFGTLGQQSLRC